MGKEKDLELVGVAEVRRVDVGTIIDRDRGHGTEYVVLENLKNPSSYALFGQPSRGGRCPCNVECPDAGEPRSVRHSVDTLFLCGILNHRPGAVYRRPSNGGNRFFRNELSGSGTQPR